MSFDVPVTNQPRRRKVTTATLQALRTRSEPAAFVTAYDYPTAVFADCAGVDMLLVGDSAAMTMLGHRSTIAITMREMLVFAGAVAAPGAGAVPVMTITPAKATVEIGHRHHIDYT